MARQYAHLDKELALLNLKMYETIRPQVIMMQDALIEELMADPATAGGLIKTMFTTPENLEVAANMVGMEMLTKKFHVLALLVGHQLLEKYLLDKELENV